MRNRYEIGQYDVTDRGNTVGLERLEDLYLEGRWGEPNVSHRSSDAGNALL